MPPMPPTQANIPAGSRAQLCPHSPILLHNTTLPLSSPSLSHTAFHTLALHPTMQSLHAIPPTYLPPLTLPCSQTRNATVGYGRLHARKQLNSLAQSIARTSPPTPMRRRINTCATIGSSQWKRCRGEWGRGGHRTSHGVFGCAEVR
jgi:hypothetical protein